MQAKHFYAFGPFRIDSQERILRREGQPVALTPKAVDILLVLVQNTEHLVDKDDLMRQVWPDAFVEEGNLTKNIFVLRKALGSRDDGQEYIETVPRRGYRFAVPVETRCEDEAQTEVVPEGPLPKPIPPAERGRIERIDRGRGYALARQSDPIEEMPETAGAPQQTSSATAGLPRQEAHEPDTRPRPRHWLVRGLAAALTMLAALAVIRSLLPTPAPGVLRTIQLTHFGRVNGVERLVSDGMQIYFTERNGGHSSLARVGIKGGDPVPIATPFSNAILYDISIARAELLVGSRSAGEVEGPLWALPAAGGSPRRLGDAISHDAVWTPDGQNVVYTSGTTLYIVRADGTEARRLGDSGGYPHYLRWSPDGQVLRFTSSEQLKHTESLWEISADGRNLHRLLSGWREAPSDWGDGESGGDWTPDGKYFIFRSSRGHTASIWAIREKADWWRPSSPKPALLTTSGLYFWTTLSGAKAGQVFFAGGTQLRELVAYDARLKQFVPYLTAAPVRRIGFSRDGQWVAYATEPGLILWRSRVDGSDRLQLTFPPMVGWDPRWSPDGKQIVFAGGPPGPESIFVISSEGGNPSVVVSGKASSYAMPQWSPDGSSLLFERQVLNPNGTVISSLLNILNLQSRVVSEVPGSENVVNPSWSPDGRYAAALSDDGRKLLLFDFQSHRWSELTSGVGLAAGPFWTRDSTCVFVQEVWSGADQPIFKVRVKDSKKELFATAKQLMRDDALGYGLVGLAPDDSPVATLLVRDTDIYLLDVILP